MGGRPPGRLGRDRRPAAGRRQGDRRAGQGRKLNPLQLANGAKALLDEVATGKITGEEDRYSHTDLWDFDANVEGSKAAIAGAAPGARGARPELVTALDERGAALGDLLEKHRAGDGWCSTPSSREAELKELTDALNALAEPVSEVAGVVAQG